jgi:hypothetical protein
MSLEDMERKITRFTKVVYVVHWGGYPIDLAKLDLIFGEEEERDW